MKKITIFFFLAGLGLAYLYLLMHRQMSVTVVQPQKKSTGSKIEAFSFYEAPKESLRGTIATMSGEVNWTARTATGPAVMRPGTLIQQGEDVETGEGGEVSLDFRENGSVTIFPETNVQIIQTLPSRMMYVQTKGKADYSSLNAPVSVRSFSLIIIIQQGKMQVSVDEDIGKVVIENIKGDVTVAFNSLEYESNVIFLQEGEQYVFDDTTREGTVERF